MFSSFNILVSAYQYSKQRVYIYVSLSFWRFARMNRSMSYPTPNVNVILVMFIVSSASGVPGTRYRMYGNICLFLFLKSFIRVRMCCSN